MRKPRAFFLLPLVLLLFVSQDVEQLPLNQQTLNQLAERATLQLEELTNSIEKLKEYNSNLEQNLSQSVEQRQTLEQQFTNSLTLANDYLTSMNLYKDRLQNSQRINRILWIVLIAWTALKVLRVILGFVKPVINKVIPWWLDVFI